jgi:hypothetical protein
MLALIYYVLIIGSLFFCPIAIPFILVIWLFTHKSNKNNKELKDIKNILKSNNVNYYDYEISLKKEDRI